MRLLGYDLNLVEFELDGGLAAKHGYDHVDCVLFDLDALHGAGEAGQRTVEDPDGIAHIVVDDDLLLLNAHGVDFIFGEGSGVVAGSTHEAGHSANIPNDVPGVIAVDHLHQHVAGEDLTVVSFGSAGLGDLGDGLHGNGDGQDLIMELAALNGLFDGGFYGVLVTGIGMNDIPLCSVCHSLSTLLAQADQSIDADTSNEIKQPDKDTDNQNAADNNQSVLQHLLHRGPNDLLQLASQLAEVLAGLAPGSLEPVFLLDFCHDLGASLLGLVVSGVLSAESAVLLHFETVGVILLVLHGVVVSLLALRASQSDFYAHNGTSLKLPPCITPPIEKF